VSAVFYWRQFFHVILTVDSRSLIDKPGYSHCESLLVAELSPVLVLSCRYATLIFPDGQGNIGRFFYRKNQYDNKINSKKKIKSKNAAGIVMMSDMLTAARVLGGQRAGNFF